MKIISGNTYMTCVIVCKLQLTNPVASVSVLRLLLAVDVDGEDRVGPGGVLVHVVVANRTIFQACTIIKMI